MNTHVINYNDLYPLTLRTCIWSQGRKTITFVDNLREDTGLDDINEINTMMLDRDVWREKAKKSRARARHK